MYLNILCYVRQHPQQAVICSEVSVELKLRNRDVDNGNPLRYIKVFIFVLK